MIKKPVVLTFFIILSCYPKPLLEIYQDDFDGSITWPELSDHITDSEDLVLNHCSHFIPMEDSDSVANEIIKILK